jgi:hypothetical protein
MTDIRNVGQEVQAEILKTVRRGQETVRRGQETVRRGQETVRRGQETVRRGQETVTEAIKTVRTMTPALSDLNLPFASKLPKPEELAGNAYSLAMKVLADQRKFAEGVLHTTGQLLPGNSGTSAKKGATPHKTGTTEATGTGGTAKKTGPGDSSK